MNNVLVGIGVLIVAILAALFAVPHFVDWNGYRGVIEEEASRITGRDVRIGGGIELQLLPVPHIVIQKLRIADVATSSGDPLFRAERIDVKLSIAPLLRGLLEANEIELTRPVLHFVLDDNGRGNWRDLREVQSALPFAPKDVALQSVTIVDGTISLLDRNGARERLTLSSIQGQFSAPALQGPYRFHGTLGENGSKRDLRFTVQPQDARGAIPIKLIVKDFETGVGATFDGRFLNLEGPPSLTGTLTASLPRPSQKPLPAAAASQEQVVSTATLADLKADVVGDSSKLELANLSIAFDSAGRPEVLAGSAKFAWDGELSTVANLSTPWLDLDNVFTNPDGGQPLAALTGFVRRMNGLVPVTGSSRATLTIEQAKLSGDSLSNVRIDAHSSQSGLAIDRLRATLPGNSRIEVKGLLSGQGAAAAFDGDFAVAGTSMARFSKWSTANAIAISAAYDQPFEMRGHFFLDPGRSRLSNVVATIGKDLFETEIDYIWGDNPRIRLDMHGARVDARALGIERLTFATVAQAAMRSSRTLAEGPQPTASSAAKTENRTDGVTLDVNLTAAELVFSNHVLRDVEATFNCSGNRLDLQRIAFKGDHGIALNFAGTVAARAGPDKASESDGWTSITPFHGSIAADDAEGLAKLEELFDWKPDTISPSLAGRMVPFKLAGTVQYSTRGNRDIANVTADGQLGDLQTRIRVETGASLNDWRTKPIDADLVFLAPNGVNLHARALGLLRTDAARQTSPRSTPSTPDGLSRIAIRAFGIPVSGLSTVVRLDSPPATAFLDGTVKVGEAADFALSANMTLDVRDARGLLEEAGAPSLLTGRPLAARGRTWINVRPGQIELQNLELTTPANTTVTGSLTLASKSVSKAGEPSKVMTGDLHFSALDVAQLLAPIVSSEGPDGGPWPRAKFDFGSTSDTDGSLGLTAKKLNLGNGVSINSVSMTLLLHRDEFGVREFTAAALGGKLVIDGQLKRADAGAALSGKVALSNADLRSFGIAGVATVTLDLAGSGTDAASLASQLKGQGALALKDAAFRALTPETLQRGIDTALAATPDKLAGTLASSVAAESALSDVKLGSKRVSIEVLDGVAKSEPVVVRSSEGRATAQVNLDLADFGIQGEWNVETRLLPLPPLPPIVGIEPAPAAAPAAGSIALPAVTQRFAIAPNESGVLRIRATPPALDALVRELSIRKVERDLSELERLRRIDEARAAEQAAAEARAREARIAAEIAEQNRQAEIKAGLKPPPPPEPPPGAPSPRFP